MAEHLNPNKYDTTGLDAEELNAAFQTKLEEIREQKQRTAPARPEQLCDSLQRAVARRSVDDAEDLPPVACSLSQAASFIGCGQEQLLRLCKNSPTLTGTLRSDGSSLWSGHVKANKFFVRRQLGLITKKNIAKQTPSYLKKKSPYPTRDELIALGSVVTKEMKEQRKKRLLEGNKNAGL